MAELPDVKNNLGVLFSSVTLLEIEYQLAGSY